MPVSSRALQYLSRVQVLSTILRVDPNTKMRRKITESSGYCNATTGIRIQTAGIITIAARVLRWINKGKHEVSFSPLKIVTCGDVSPSIFPVDNFEETTTVTFTEKVHPFKYHSRDIPRSSFLFSIRKNHLHKNILSPP
jgi:hypothetical protein